MVRAARRAGEATANAIFFFFAGEKRAKGGREEEQRVSRESLGREGERERALLALLLFFFPLTPLFPR